LAKETFITFEKGTSVPAVGHELEVGIVVLASCPPQAGARRMANTMAVAVFRVIVLPS
jgi:hypothetical protein